MSRSLMGLKRKTALPSVHLIVQEAESVMPLDPALCRKIVLFLCETWSGIRRTEILRHFRLSSAALSKNRSRFLKELAEDPGLALTMETIRSRIYLRMRRPSCFLM